MIFAFVFLLLIRRYRYCAIVSDIAQKPDDLHFDRGLLSVYLRWNLDIDHINNSIIAEAPILDTIIL